MSLENAWEYRCGRASASTCHFEAAAWTVVLIVTTPRRNIVTFSKERGEASGNCRSHSGVLEDGNLYHEIELVASNQLNHPVDQ